MTKKMTWVFTGAIFCIFLLNLERTSVISQEPTGTPIPNGSISEVWQEVLRPTSGCELPCWWNIRPGETHKANAINVLNNKFDDIELLSNPNATSDFLLVSNLTMTSLDREQNLVYPLSMFLYFSDDTVDYISLGVGDMALQVEEVREIWSQYSISSMFERYGTPDTIMFDFQETTSRVVGEQIVLIWQDIDVAISYIQCISNCLPSVPSNQICFTSDRLVDIGLLLDSSTNSRQVNQLVLEKYPELTSLQSVSNISPASLISLLINNNECLPSTFSLRDVISTSTPTPAPTDLTALVTQCVTDRGLRNSLTVKINNTQWGAFINEVEAQRGKKITVECADQLIEMATYLRDNP